MRRGHRTITLSLAVVLVSFACLEALAKEEWTIVRTRNFTLVGNAGERDIRRVGAQLEQFRAAFARLFTNARLNSPAPTRVIVFRNDSAFRPFKPLYQGKPMEIDGYFQGGTDVNYIALTPSARGSHPYSVIFHEYVHALTKNNAQRSPVWFREGLAEYYSTFEVADGGRKILLGKPLASHVYLLRERDLLPLSVLFAVDQDSPHYNEREKKGVFYAQSWALVHYFLLSDDGTRRAQFTRYLNLLASGAPVEESFRQAFKTDFAALEAELKAYITRNRYSFEEVTLGARLEVEAEMETARLGEADAQYYLGDLLLHLQRLDEAEGYLRQAISLDARHAAAHASLGLLRMDQKRFADAREHLGIASSSGASNHLVHYYYALALSREQTGEGNLVARFTPESVVRMRDALRRAIELAPEFAEAYRLLAFVHLVAGEDLDEAERLAVRARRLAPGEGEYGYLLAQIHMRQNRYAAAREVLSSLIAEGAEPGLRARAQGMIETIGRIEAEMARREREAMEAEKRRPVLALPAAGASNDQAPGVRRRPHPLADGEREIEGMLVDIACAESAVTLTVRSGEAVMRFQAASPESVVFIRYTPGVGLTLTCGAQKPPARVRVIYRPLAQTAGRARSRVKVDGEPVRVEFLKPE